MKRVLLLLLLLTIAALGIWFAVRGNGGGAAVSTLARVTALLPAETLGFVYVPDFEEVRTKWRESDLYKLWREPAMQEFMQRPLARVPEGNVARERMKDLEQLGARDLFVALLAWEGERATLAGGFRFKGSQADAERVIARWRSRWAEQLPDARREVQGHQGHQLEVLRSPALTLVTTYARNWFFVTNDVEALKAVLDRADGRVRDAAQTLKENEAVNAALKPLPERYAALGYARVESYMERLGERLGRDLPQAGVLREIRSVAATTNFEDGRVRDVFYIAMPRAGAEGELTQQSLALATPETFLFFATILSPPHPAAKEEPAAGSARSGVPGALRRLFAAGAANQITREAWREAFGEELGLVGDWPAVSRLPAVFLSLEVKNAEKARAIIETITTGASESGTWTATEENGVRYFSQPPPNPLVPMALTIALSDTRMVAGLDMASVKRAIAGGDPRSGLATTESFKSAIAAVPVATHSFTYVDTALLYQRLDAALRPMLVMAAAFLPKLSEKVDWSKLPPAEVIAQHLSPLVVSQAYVGNGYRLESIGPTSLYQVALGAFLATGEATATTGPGFQAFPGILPGSVPATATPEPSPSP